MLSRFVRIRNHSDYKTTNTSRNNKIFLSSDQHSQIGDGKEWPFIINTANMCIKQTEKKQQLLTTATVCGYQATDLLNIRRARKKEQQMFVVDLHSAEHTTHSECLLGYRIAELQITPNYDKQNIHAIAAQSTSINACECFSCMWKKHRNTRLTSAHRWDWRMHTTKRGRL